MSKNLPTIDSLRQAVETRDAKSLKAFYAEDAVLTIIDSDNPPSKPRIIKGSKEIGSYLDDVYGRDMQHTIDYGVIDGKHLAFVQGCSYGDGMHVIASTTAELGTGGIIKQTIVQAWDS